MILEEDQIKTRIENLRMQIKVQEKLIEMAEPFEMMKDNAYYQKILGFYKDSADVYQRKINSLTSDMANDGASVEEGIPENPVFHQLRVSSSIAKAIVARDTLLSFVNEPAQIIEAAKLAVEKIEALKKEITDLEDNANGK